MTAAAGFSIGVLAGLMLGGICLLPTIVRLLAERDELLGAGEGDL